MEEDIGYSPKSGLGADDSMGGKLQGLELQPYRGPPEFDGLKAIELH